MYPLDNWTAGRITLLGDADCLARQLNGYDGDIGKAFAAYQAERIPRTAQVQRVARHWGQVWHDDGPVIPVLRDLVLIRRGWDDYADLDWLYQERHGHFAIS